MNTPGPGVVALIVVRDGTLPLGAVETALEANGNVVLVGTGVTEAAAELAGENAARTVRTLPLALDDLGSVAEAVVGHVAAFDRIVCPGSPDGRDLAPRLAYLRGEPLFASAIRIRPDRVTLTRSSGHIGEEFTPPSRFVATLVPGVRGVERPYDTTEVIETTGSSTVVGGTTGSDNRSVATLAIVPPDPDTMDLTEAKRIVGGGQGLGSAERFVELQRFASGIGASLGGTRVASDAGWIPFERQIGTTGVIVHPSLYLAFAISGATQHTTGLGDPDHVISVNLDGSCPMMAMADLAIVSDANDVIASLLAKIDDRSHPGAVDGNRSDSATAAK